MKDNASLYVKELTRNNKLPIFLMVVRSIIDTIASMLLAWVLMEIINLVSSESKYSLLKLLLIGSCAFILIIAQYVFEYFSSPKFRSRAIAQYNSLIFKRLTQKNIRAFSKEKSSHYISGLSNDLNQIEEGYVGGYIEIFHIALMAIASLAMMLYYSPTLTLASIVLSCLPILAALLSSNRLVKAEEELARENQRYIGVLQDSINGFSVIKGFKAEDGINNIVNERIDGVKNSKEHKLRLNVFVNLMADSSAIILQLSIFFIGAYLALYPKSINIGTVMLFVQLTGYILDPIEIIPRSVIKIRAAKGLIRRMANAIDENNCPDNGEAIDKIGDIKIENLSYSYGGEKLALNDISLELKENKSYAIVGASGSGKSTILSLLEGGASDYSGLISFQDTDLREISLASLYEHLSIVEQRVFIFDANIVDNITMFKKFSSDEVERAIELSGLGELIKERGLDYLCGENGSSLSGGEKQRISIARALLQKSSLILCDEMTAALDNETAVQVMNSVLDLRNITKVVVTHSLKECILKRFDKIFVMKEGRLVEGGSFDELMNNRGYFYSLFVVSQ